MSRTSRLVSWVVIGAAAFLLGAHALQWDRIKVDSTTLGLLGLILGIPLLEFVRKVKFGGIEAEIEPREVAAARAKVSSEVGAPAEEPGDKAEEDSALLSLVRQDPQLGLAKLRIEIEQALRSLARFLDPKTEWRVRSISQLSRELAQAGVVPPEVSSAIGDILPLANRAIHGEFVRTQDAEELARLGQRVLAELRNLHRDRVVHAFERVPITPADRDRFMAARYHVETIVPLVEDPYVAVRRVDQEGLDELLEGYDQHAEFLFRMHPVDDISSS